MLSRRNLDRAAVCRQDKAGPPLLPLFLHILPFTAFVAPCPSLSDQCAVQFAIDEGKLDLNTVLTVELKNKIKGKSRTAAPLVGSATCMSEDTCRFASSTNTYKTFNGSVCSAVKLADILKDAELADILKDTEKQWDCEIVLKKKVCVAPV